MTGKPPFRPGELVVSVIDPTTKLVVNKCVFIDKPSLGYDPFWWIDAIDLMDVDHQSNGDSGPANYFSRYPVEW